MTALLYYSYSRNLTEAEIIEIDKKVFINRELVYQFMTKLSSNTKRKTVIIVVCLGFVLVFSNIESVEAIGLSLSPTPVVKVQPNYKDTYEMKVAPTVSPKLDKITFIKYRELPVCIYMMDDRFLKTSEASKLINKIRGGSLIEAATALVVIVVMWQILGVGIEGFVLPNPGWGVDRPNQFQPPGGHLRYPPVYDLFSPRRTCYADRPGGSLMMSEVNPQSSREELTQLSTDVVPTQTQMSGFVRDSKVDLHKCLDEVNRRASEIGCTDFECSLERFKALATENGKLTSTSAREAITILQGEMQGYYTNARREDYGLDVKGPDFLVEGLGEFQNITHVEVKNPVGSAIKIANGQSGSIAKQGKKIGAKIVYQQNYWSNTTKTSDLENLNPTASLPQSPNNMLGAVDNFDVPSSEKAFMEASVLKGSQNNTNIIFLNNN